MLDGAVSGLPALKVCVDGPNATETGDNKQQGKRNIDVTFHVWTGKVGKRGGAEWYGRRLQQTSEHFLLALPIPQPDADTDR